MYQAKQQKKKKKLTKCSNKALATWQKAISPKTVMQYHLNASLTLGKSKFPRWAKTSSMRWQNTAFALRKISITKINENKTHLVILSRRTGCACDSTS
jgi:hypothetical protein